MIRTIIKHYLYDSAISIFFDNVSSNFIKSDESFYNRYIKYSGAEVSVELTDNCINDRNLSVCVIVGLVELVDDHSIKIWMSHATSNFIGWYGYIFLYDGDIHGIYKLEA